MLGLLRLRAWGEGAILPVLRESMPFTLLLLAFAGAAALGGAGVYGWWSGRNKEKDWQSRMAGVARLNARLETLEAVVESGPHSVFLWQGDEPERHYSGLVTPPDAPLPQDFSAFCNSLYPDSARALTQAMQGLQEKGTRFAFPLFCADGRSFAGLGRPAGMGVVLTVTDVSEGYKEITILRDMLSETVHERDFLRQIVDDLPHPAWLRQADGGLIWVNRAYMRAVEAATVEEVIRRDEALFTAPAAGETAPSGVTRRLRTVIAGQRRTMDVVELTTERGTAGLAVDVTEADEARTEARQQLAAQRANLYLLKTPVAIFSTYQNLEFFNQAFADLWGLPAEWLANGPQHGELLEAMRETRRLPEQADFPAWKKKQLASYANLVAPQEEIWHLPNDRTLRLIIQPTPQGGIFVVYEDLTEMLNLERSYNALSRVQRESLNNLQEGVTVFGVDGRLGLFNPAFLRIWQLHEAQLTNRPHIDKVVALCTPLMPDARVWDQIKSQILGSEKGRDLALFRLETGQETVLDCAAVPLPDGGAMLTFFDVTSTVQIERALRERNDALETADRLKSEFITHISYQFRTPLNSIIGFAEILEHEFFGPLNGRQHEYSQGLLEASQHLLTLVNDVIDLATIEAGHMSLAWGAVDIYGLLGSVRDLSRQRARDSDMTLLMECPEDIGVIHADSRRIKQVMFNLLSNAFQFSSPGDEVTIGARRCLDKDGAEICQLWVRDRGIGIAPAYQDKMFNRFEALPPQGKEKRAGLGLSLVRHLVELHDGWVDVESTPNQGTVVTCNLPVRMAAVQPESLLN